jgi:formylglycine-generating enzyme required for sulfatase activity
MPEYMKSYKLTYSLPSEAQWVYAAQGFYELVFPEDTPTVDTSAYASTDSVGVIALPTDSTQTPHDSAWVAAQVHKKFYDDSLKAAIRDQKMVEKQKTTVHKKSQPMNPNLYVMDYIKMLYFFNHRYNGYIDTTKAIDSTLIHKDPNGMLMNFKQAEGDYWEDGAALTAPVMSFAPNEYGLYNMEGNVSEWTMDAYSPSAYSFVADINPVLMYDADSTDAEVMKRKVVRGGSFIGNAKSLSPFYRDMELMNVSHCYIGFRTVMLAPEIVQRNTSTRNKTLRGKRTPGKFSGTRLPEIH